MIVTPDINRHNRRYAGIASTILILIGALLAWYSPPLAITLVFAPIAYWLIRRKCLRRLAVARGPFPSTWQEILDRRVRFYQALDDRQKDRFRQMVSIFLDEIQVTGVRTEVDDTVRVLVAASAIIPIFGFEDWDYHRLGEVLVYPGSFDQQYQTDNASNANILGLTGLAHLRGVMILSKPSLLTGFNETDSQENVGIHEFAHLVEQEEVDRGLPPEVPADVVRQWIAFVAGELRHPSTRQARINNYAYTNEHEFFAVISEYFFNSPETLKAKDPTLYGLLRTLFHQDPASLRGHLPRARPKYGRNELCPCGSGKKFKDCCCKGPLETSNAK